MKRFLLPITAFLWGMLLAALGFNIRYDVKSWILAVASLLTFWAGYAQGQAVHNPKGTKHQEILG